MGIPLATYPPHHIGGRERQAQGAGFNEMDAPQITYSDDDEEEEEGVVGAAAGWPGYPHRAMAYTWQARTSGGRERSSSSSWP